MDYANKIITMDKILKCADCAYYQHYRNKPVPPYTFHCPKGQKRVCLYSRRNVACKYFISKIFKITKP